MHGARHVVRRMQRAKPRRRGVRSGAHATMKYTTTGADGFALKRSESTARSALSGAPATSCHRIRTLHATEQRTCEPSHISLRYCALHEAAAGRWHAQAARIGTAAPCAAGRCARGARPLRTGRGTQHGRRARCNGATNAPASHGRVVAATAQRRNADASPSPPPRRFRSPGHPSTALRVGAGGLSPSAASEPMRRALLQAR
jgi:hypothetical protein